MNEENFHEQFWEEICFPTYWPIMPHLINASFVYMLQDFTFLWIIWEKYFVDYFSKKNTKLWSTYVTQNITKLKKMHRRDTSCFWNKWLQIHHFYFLMYTFLLNYWNNNNHKNSSFITHDLLTKKCIIYLIFHSNVIKCCQMQSNVVAFCQILVKCSQMLVKCCQIYSTVVKF